jgi:hypothetical protein
MVVAVVEAVKMPLQVLERLIKDMMVVEEELVRIHMVWVVAVEQVRLVVLEKHKVKVV